MSNSEQEIREILNKSIDYSKDGEHFEYKQILLKHIMLDEDLNKLGTHSFELVNILPHAVKSIMLPGQMDIKFLHIFKRKIINETDE